MADVVVENPSDDVAAAEPDVNSQCGIVCVSACCTLAVASVSSILVLLFSRSGHAHTSAAVRAMAAAGLAVGVPGLFLGALCCAVTLAACIHGDFSGKPQEVAPFVEPV